MRELKVFGAKGAAFVMLLAAMFVSGCQTTTTDYSGQPFNDNLEAQWANPPAASGDTGTSTTAWTPAGFDATRTPGGVSNLLRVGDLVTVIFSDLPNPPPPHEERIKDDGTITLHLIGPVVAEGKTTGQLQREIHSLYVPKFYQRLGVTVKTQDQFYTVDGEVKNPSRQVYLGKTTLLGAIASASGFTDFANKKNVQLIRANGETETVNTQDILKNPSRDIEIYPGDRIIVKRRWF